MAIDHIGNREVDLPRDVVEILTVVDDANDVLVSPFSEVTHSGNIWVERGVPSLLAFLLYFVLLRILANYAVRLQGGPSLSRT